MKFQHAVRRLVGAAALVLLLTLGGGATALAQDGADSLDTLVAPIALYPDALVAQILPASTQPLQVVEAAESLAHGARPSQAQASQWDPSVQALVSFPTVLKMMEDKVEWTEHLGKAVAADPSAVMASIQRVRAAAMNAGNLKSNDKQVVEVQAQGSGDVITSTIVIEPANPQIIYVPQYNPVLITAPPPPSYGYPPPMMTFGLGFAAGAATAYACNWGNGGSGNVTVNNTYAYSSTNAYGAYHPANTTYHSTTGSAVQEHSAYTGYDANSGTYGAYNPNTGKYATYNPSTGAYNKDGTTGTYQKPASSSGTSSSTWHPPSSSQVSQSAATSRSAQYRSDSPSSAYHGSAAGGAFAGAGGGGWGAREASARGERSFGGGGFGGRGGGFRR